MASNHLYTAELFPPLHRELLALLRGLAPDDWTRPTVAGGWRVRDTAMQAAAGRWCATGKPGTLYNALPADQARARAAVEGDASLAAPLFAMRSVMV